MTKDNTHLDYVYIQILCTARLCNLQNEYLLSSRGHLFVEMIIEIIQ